MNVALHFLVEISSHHDTKSIREQGKLHALFTPVNSRVHLPSRGYLWLSLATRPPPMSFPPIPASPPFANLRLRHAHDPRRTCDTKMPTWKLRALFRDHALGVQTLSYLAGMLLSAGFDWEIIAWDAERLEKIGTMTGHKAPVTAVAQVRHDVGCPLCYTPKTQMSHRIASIGFRVDRIIA